MSKDKKIFWGITAFILLVLIWFTFCTPTQAAEKDADFYKRTATKPPSDAVPYMATTWGYTDNPMLGVGAGALFKESGVLILGSATYTRPGGGDTMTTPFVVGCRTYQVPYQTPETGGWGATLTVAFPVGKRKP
jgi:hypothetical protein